MLKIFGLTAILIVLFTVPVMAGISDNWNNWSKTDTTWQLSFTSITAFDLYQTGIALQNGGREISPFATPFIGERPTETQLYIFGTEWILVNYLIARSLSPKSRRIFQAVCSSVTFYEVANSYGTKIVLKIPL